MTIDGAKKPRRGRPRVDTRAVNVRIPKEMLAALDAFAATQTPPFTRPDAVRAMAAAGLKAVTPPPGWGGSGLTQFFDYATNNRYATFVHYPAAVRDLTEIDEVFERLDGMKDPPNRLAAMLAFRSHAAFRAACEHALAGQLGDVFPAVRACIENAAYAVYLNEDLALAEAWVRRHDSAEARKAMRGRDFHHSTIRDAIKALDDDLGVQFGELYETAIDYGGHPNERGLTVNTVRAEGKDGGEVRQIYLHQNGPQLALGLRTTVEAGLCAIAILRLIFLPRLGAESDDQRMKREKLGVDRRGLEEALRRA